MADAGQSGGQSVRDVEQTVDQRLNELEARWDQRLDDVIAAVEEGLRKVSNGRLEKDFEDQKRVRAADMPTISIAELTSQVAQAARSAMSDAGFTPQLVEQMHRLLRDRQEQSLLADDAEVTFDAAGESLLLGWQSMLGIWAEAVARSIFVLEQYRPTEFFTRISDRLMTLQEQEV